jgi:hypothetical protein
MRPQELPESSQTEPGDAPPGVVGYAAFVARVPRGGGGTASGTRVAKVAWVGRIATMAFGSALALIVILLQ